jgi:hypothetical protein
VQAKPAGAAAGTARKVVVPLRCIDTTQGEQNLAKPNFGYQKRQKELEKKRKKEEKMKKKLEKNAAPAADADAPAPAPEGGDPV